VNSTPLAIFLDRIWLIPMFPLAGAALMFFFGRRLANSIVNAICVGSVAVSFVFALGAFFQLVGLPDGQRIAEKVVFDWVPAGIFHTNSGHIAHFDAQWGFLLDPLSSVMILVVTGVGLLIHIYSTGYMGHEGGYYRFFGYLNLFMFSMLILVLANNLLLLFVGWEGVGTCSYLLIGFYFKRKSASDAGKKAFIVNRVGDAGFLLGIFLTSGFLGTIRFTEIVPALSTIHPHIGGPIVTAIALLFFWGATGKSAQIPLYIWLPDAMEGPTPVSALIHAATMVTAGVYMVTRTNVMFRMAPLAMDVVAIIGVCTAILAATMALVQTDIKKVLAYSTISQLGYMFLGCGVGAFAAGIFHVMTHAFFKALLFLAAGSVIHAMSGEQDMRKMGALAKKIPTTYRTMLIATLAIAGIPPLAGFFSKDEILARSFERSPVFWVLAWLTAGLTAFYMFRLIFMTFHGTSRVDHETEHHIHESPKSMLAPLMVLALLSIVGGWVNWPHFLGGSDHFLDYINSVQHVSASVETAPAPEAPAGIDKEDVVARSVIESNELPQKIEETTTPEKLGLVAASVLIALGGIWLAWFLYLKNLNLPAKIASSAGGLYRLLVHKYYVDEIYDAMFVNRSKDMGTSLGMFDAKIIDGLGVNGAAWLTRVISRISMWWDTWIVDGSIRLAAGIVGAFGAASRYIQNGELQEYMLVIVIGVIGFLGYTLYWLRHYVR
jgi:NADH-quinone oxidoreductase subunit L